MVLNKRTRIYLGADHAGFELKEKIKSWLSEWGKQYEDLGNRVLDPQDDFPDFAKLVAQKVSENSENALGLLVCGSGAGVDVVANKFSHVRSSVLFSPEQAVSATEHDAVNVACLSSRFVDEEANKKIVKIWLETPFAADSEKRIRRVKKIEEIEEKNMK